MWWHFSSRFQLGVKIRLEKWLENTFVRYHLCISHINFYRHDWNSFEIVGQIYIKTFWKINEKTHSFAYFITQYSLTTPCYYIPYDWTMSVKMKEQKIVTFHLDFIN